MAKFLDADGNEVEAFTQAEVDAIRTEAESKITAAMSEKADLEKKLEGLSDKDKNFAALKSALDEKTKIIDGLSQEIKSVKEVREADMTTAMISKFAKGNEELAKKIAHHYNETLKSVDAKSQEEIAKKVESALKLSVETKADADVLGAAIAGGTGYSAPAAGGSATAVEFTSEQKALGKKMGISEEDYKKYGNDPRINNIGINGK